MSPEFGFSSNDCVNTEYTFQLICNDRPVVDISVKKVFALYNQPYPSLIKFVSAQTLNDKKWVVNDELQLRCILTIIDLSNDPLTVTTERKLVPINVLPQLFNSLESSDVKVVDGFG